MRSSCRPRISHSQHFQEIARASQGSPFFWKACLIFFVLGALFFTRVTFSQTYTLLALVFALFCLLTSLAIFTVFHCYTPVVVANVLLLLFAYFFLDSLGANHTTAYVDGIVVILLLLLLIWVTIRILSTHSCTFLTWLLGLQIFSVLLVLGLLTTLSE